MDRKFSRKVEDKVHSTHSRVASGGGGVWVGRGWGEDGKMVWWTNEKEGAE